MSAQPWYLDPISMRFGATEGNGVSTEKGVDLRVPYHTPITPLFPGTVRSVATGPYGQEVDVTGLLNGQQVTASYVHLDQALVSPGQPVGLNTELGISGGQNVGGYHPASPAYSSGPHIEFSLWNAGQTPYVGTPINPMSFINAVQGSGGALLPSLDTANTGQAFSGPQAARLGGFSGVLGNIPNPFSGPVTGAVQGATGATLVNVTIPNYLDQIKAQLGLSSLSDLAWRAGLLLLALVLVIVVAQAVAHKETQQIAGQVGQLAAVAG